MVPVTAVDGELGEEMVPVMLVTCDQVPKPTAGVLAINVRLPVQAVSWLAPATDVVGGALVVIRTISWLVPQFPLVTFHCNKYTPAVAVDKLVVGEFALTKLAPEPG